MSIEDTQNQEAEVNITNIGGIEESSVALPSGVSLLVGRNATNRTSFLQAVMAACGSDKATLKGDADEGQVSLTMGGEKYTRTLSREGGSVVMSGSPYLDDATSADLFAFLLESNEARRAVAQDSDLRELIMRPVDTDAIESDIRRLKKEKDQLSDKIEDLADLRDEIPTLEQKRSDLDEQIEAKQAELAEKEEAIETHEADVDETREDKQELEDRLGELRDTRSTLERIRSDIKTEEQSIESLGREREELQNELDDLPDNEDVTSSDLDYEIDRLRSEKEELNGEISTLQDIIQFNEEMLEAGGEAVSNVVSDDTGDSNSDITAQLVEDSENVVCWTCGSEVAQDIVEQTISQMKDVRQEKLSSIRSIEDDLEDLQAEKRDRRSRRNRRENIERKLEEISTELEDRRETLEERKSERERLNGEIETLEQEVEMLEAENFSDIIDLHKEANEIEFELGRLQSDQADVEDRISSIEEQIAEEDELRDRREEISAELTDLRTRIEQIEEHAVEQFNDHMDAVLDILGYENLDRIWVERIETEVREGRQKVQQTKFEIHVVRSTTSGTTYEDTIDHLSESEREVTGLVFALAGYLVHDLYEVVPFMLLDSLEAIDADRQTDLVSYFEDYADFLVVALLEEDAQAFDETYDRITDI